jgi:Zn-dependent protease with chaperone function
MFALRGIAVSLSVFVMVYAALSLAVVCTWRRLWRRSQQRAAGRMADRLFVFRMLPCTAATVVTAAFTVPSFLLFEPRAIAEPVGVVPVALGVCGALVGVLGVWNAGVALRKASRAIAEWTHDARAAEFPTSVPVLKIARAVPAMTAAGIVNPRLLVSGMAECLLTRTELQAALNHEVAHVQRRDNLKKLLLRLVAFPGMSRLNTAWLEATEMAADDAAVSTNAEALDLAAALIKLSRCASLAPEPELTTALVSAPVSAVQIRVERLIAWSSERGGQSRFFSWGRVAAVSAAAAMFALTYSQILIHVHTATEWLVR